MTLRTGSPALAAALGLDPTACKYLPKTVRASTNAPPSATTAADKTGAGKPSKLPVPMPRRFCGTLMFCWRVICPPAPRKTSIVASVTISAGTFVKATADPRRVDRARHRTPRHSTSPSQHRSYPPRGDLLGTEPQQLGLAGLPGGHVNETLEQSRAFDHLTVAGERRAGVEVHVADHVLVKGAGGGDLQARDRPRPEYGSAPGRKSEQVRPACHHASRGHRVVAWGVHEGQPPGVNRLSVVDDRLQRARAAFQDRAE